MGITGVFSPGIPPWRRERRPRGRRAGGGVCLPPCALTSGEERRRPRFAARLLGGENAASVAFCYSHWGRCLSCDNHHRGILMRSALVTQKLITAEAVHHLRAEDLARPALPGAPGAARRSRAGPRRVTRLFLKPELRSSGTTTFCPSRCPLLPLTALLPAERSAVRGPGRSKGAGRAAPGGRSATGSASVPPPRGRRSGACPLPLSAGPRAPHPECLCPG